MKEIMDFLNHLPAEGCRLKGPLGQALEQAVAKRLLKINYPNLVAPFRLRNEVDGAWRGEFWGKIVRSAILAYRGTGNLELLAVIRRTVADLLSTQTPDGGISTSPADGQLGLRRPGMAPYDFLPGAWDVWGRKYVLLALLRYCDEIEADPQTIKACQKVIDHLSGQLKEANRPLTDCGRQDGLAAASILGAAVGVWRIGGAPEHLLYAQKIIAGGCSASENIFEAIAKGKHPREISVAKAYEMLSCFQGLADLQLLAPQPGVTALLVEMYELVRDREIFVTGTAGLRDEWGEYWDDGALKQHRTDAGALGETCITATWLHYCERILRLTADAAVYDQMEKSFYNAALGAMRPDGAAWIHANPTPLAGSSWKKPAGDQLLLCINSAFDGNDCCLAQGPETLAMAPYLAVLQQGDTLYLNGFEDAQYQFHQVALKLSGNYPVEPRCNILLTLDRLERFTLAVRIPGWGGQLSLNGETVKTVAGTYCKLDREWRNGDVLSLSFDFTPRKIELPGTRERFAVQSGPWILAQDSHYGTVDAPVDMSQPCRRQTIAGARQAWQIGDQTLIDYASAGSGFCEDHRLCVLFQAPASFAKGE